MAPKHKLHHWLVVVRRIRSWQLLVLLIIFVASSAYFLRQNNLEMLRLRNVVDQADLNNGDVKTALINLQHFVTAHMNTNLGDGVALQNTYQRAYEAAVNAAANADNPQAPLYTQVELECRPVYQRTHSFPAYTQCAHDKLGQLAPGTDPLATLKTPPADLYRFNYVSPIWSPDLAGFSVLLAIVIGVMLILRLVTYYVLRAILRARR
jgi:hypothetical protein